MNNGEKPRIKYTQAVPCACSCHVEDTILCEQCCIPEWLLKKVKKLTRNLIRANKTIRLLAEKHSMYQVKVKK